MENIEEITKELNYSNKNISTEKELKERIDIVETTFKEMGIRKANKIAEHLIKENTYNSNLFTDISTVNYTKGNHGKMHLEETPTFPVFIDDL